MSGSEAAFDSQPARPARLTLEALLLSAEAEFGIANKNLWYVPPHSIHKGRLLG